MPRRWDRHVRSTFRAVPPAALLVSHASAPGLTGVRTAHRQNAFTGAP